ncbi:hypothetical protein FQZ97_822900 [compost metagenome]
MARPSAASSRMLPRLMPVKACASALPMASVRSSASSDDCRAPLTAALVSLSRRCSNRGRTSGLRVSPSFCAAARRCASSSLASSTAACASSSVWRAWGSRSAASARSISGSCATSGSSKLLRCRLSAASRWRSGSPPTSCMPASAVSIAPRMRLLMVTSCASSVSATASPVTASTAASSRTISTCVPCTRTASSAMAWIRVAAALSSVATASRFRVAMRSSLSPVASTWASAGVSAWARPLAARQPSASRRKALCSHRPEKWE